MEHRLDTTLLRQLYGDAETARERCRAVCAGFADTFGRGAEALFSAPGRTELGGNHTDHQHGCVLAASVDLDILAAASPNHSSTIRIQSQGYPLIEVDLRQLTPIPEEQGTSAALVRGMAARMTEMGCPVSGLDAYMVSGVPGGSGLSSSAAFEVLVGTMLGEMFGAGSLSAVEIAKIGQYAENVYFGKPCGLMDQTASAVGGAVFIDFADPAHPSVEQVPLDPEAAGYALCILDSGADHADLTGEYAAITEELRAVCSCFGKAVLRDVPETEFFAALPQVRAAAGDRAVLRAMHVYAENRRAGDEARALKRRDFEAFLELVRQSGRSSALYLQNIVPTGSVRHQELLAAIALCEHILAGRGAVRVHGGGFGGTVQAYVPLDMLGQFRDSVNALLGQERCRVVRVRPVGSCRLA